MSKIRFVSLLLVIVVVLGFLVWGGFSVLRLERGTKLNSRDVAKQWDLMGRQLNATFPGDGRVIDTFVRDLGGGKLEAYILIDSRTVNATDIISSLRVAKLTGNRLGVSRVIWADLGTGDPKKILLWITRDSALEMWTNVNTMRDIEQIVQTRLYQANTIMFLGAVPGIEDGIQQQDLIGAVDLLVKSRGW